MKINFLIGLSFGAILACGGDIGIARDKTQNDTNDAVQEPIDEPEITTDFVVRGPHETNKDNRAVEVTNCSNMNYSVYSPVGIEKPPVAILGHGFARGPDTMVGWADHLASWGVEVLLPTLCHYNILAGVDHEMNGQNMIELADHHGATEVVYGGHSAGGLAAIIAASQDSDSLGVLGLDTTDTENVPNIPDFIGQQYAADVKSPAFLVMGEPSSCNSDNNGLQLFEMMEDSYILKVDDADHCDFESPTDFVCEMNCENNNAETSDEQIRSLIFTLGTSAILSLTDLSEDGWIIWR